MIPRCNKCILPTNYPEINFNADNICNYCTTYIPQKPHGASKFEEIINEAKQKSLKYDCLVPLSGGRDSTYVLYQMKHVFGMDVLAFNYDNGFVSDIARNNIERITQTLGVDLEYLKSKNDIQCKNLRHVVKLNLRKSPAHVILSLCSGCRNGIWGGAYSTAKKHGIPLVIFGESSMESGTAKKIFGRQLKRSSLEKMKYALKLPLNFLMRKYYTSCLNKEFPLDDFTDIKKVNFFDYFLWDEKEMMDILKSKLNWGVETNMSSWRFDCKIHAVVNYMHQRLYGFTEKDELYSKMIRENLLTRDQALEKIKTNCEGENRELEVVKEVFDRLKLSEKERSAIINLETLL